MNSDVRANPEGTTHLPAEELIHRAEKLQALAALVHYTKLWRALLDEYDA